MGQTVRAFKMYEAAATDSYEEEGGEENVNFTAIQEVFSVTGSQSPVLENYCPATL